MTEDTDKPISLTITDPYEIPITFVNEVVGRGHLNGVINLTFATARFTPTAGEIAPDLVITARLRMDMACLRQTYMVLGELISMNEPDDRSKPN